MPLPDGLKESKDVNVANVSENAFQDLAKYVDLDDLESPEDGRIGNTNINWTELEGIYPNIIGWVTGPDTAIDAPLLYYRTKDEVPADENAFYVVTDKDATMDSENTVIYAPLMDFSAYKDPNFIQPLGTDDSSAFDGTIRTCVFIFLKSGRSYSAYLWNVSNANTFNGFKLETRNFKNLFEKKDWMDAAFEQSANPRISYVPEDISPLMTLVGLGRHHYSLFFELTENFNE